ncbi:MAG: DUF5011 domain-containing protein [Bacteroidia bacterium]|nr:DUF5011 domain-containing protein [Bacteroidia bacterium]
MKQTMKFAAVVALALSTVLVGCKKDDVDAPVVTLLGAASESKILNASYTDAGATSKDERDGDLTSSIVSDAATAVKKDLAGNYTVTYTSTDAAGNAGKATRTVMVKNAADAKAGSYAVTDLSGGFSSNYSDAAVASSTVNNRILVGKFANYSGAGVYMTISTDGLTVTVPSQTVASGTPAANRTFAGSGTVSSTGMVIDYTETTNNTTVTGKGTYTKQ